MAWPPCKSASPRFQFFSLAQTDALVAVAFVTAAAFAAGCLRFVVDLERLVAFVATDFFLVVVVAERVRLAAGFLAGARLVAARFARAFVATVFFVLVVLVVFFAFLDVVVLAMAVVYTRIESKARLMLRVFSRPS